MAYSTYKKEIKEDLNKCLNKMGCQPILFIGAGLSQRYFNAPNWKKLLTEMSQICPTIDKDVAYYLQAGKDLIEIGTIYSDKFREWAWTSGKEEFSKELFEENKDGSVYLKQKVVEYLESITPKEIEHIDEKWQLEIDLLKKINPHAIITTNYDTLLEMLYSDYKTIIGQEILTSNYVAVGEILKIHGCVSNFENITLVEKDYEEFKRKKKYLSAKLLTYFLEHPLIFIGYGAQDPNIIAILSDIDEIISNSEEVIPNIYLVEYKEDLKEQDYPRKEKLIKLDSNKSLSIKSIVAKDYDWIYEILGENRSLSKVNPKLMRSLLARTYDLVRKDIPKKTIEIDYTTLEHALESQDELGKLLGITTISNPEDINKKYIYTITNIGTELGYQSWHPANKLIMKIKKETGINLKDSDNKYHIAIKSGNMNNVIHKYSPETIDLLKKVKNGIAYPLDLQ